MLQVSLLLLANIWMHDVTFVIGEFTYTLCMVHYYKAVIVEVRIQCSRSSLIIAIIISVWIDDARIT